MCTAVCPCQAALEGPNRCTAHVLTCMGPQLPRGPFPHAGPSCPTPTLAPETVPLNDEYLLPFWMVRGLGGQHGASPSSCLPSSTGTPALASPAPTRISPSPCPPAPSRAHRLRVLHLHHCDRPALLRSNRRPGKLGGRGMLAGRCASAGMEMRLRCDQYQQHQGAVVAHRRFLIVL